MSEEPGQSSIRLCPMCEHSCDTTKWRHFVDPYSGQIEEFLACDACFNGVYNLAWNSWDEDFGITMEVEK